MGYSPYQENYIPSEADVFDLLKLMPDVGPNSLAATEFRQALRGDISALKWIAKRYQALIEDNAECRNTVSQLAEQLHAYEEPLCALDTHWEV